MILTKYYSGDRIEKNEIGGAYSSYGGEQRCIQGFGGETCGKLEGDFPLAISHRTCMTLPDAVCTVLDS